MKKSQTHPDAELHPDIRRLRRLAVLLDSAFTIPIIKRKIGLDPLLGLIPGAGDTVSLLLSGYMIYTAYRLGLPNAVLLAMLANVAIDTGIGLVPVLGDIVDVFWKANLRNLALLEAAYLRHDTLYAENQPASASTIDVMAEPV